MPWHLMFTKKIVHSILIYSVLTIFDGLLHSATQIIVHRICFQKKRDLKQFKCIIEIGSAVHKNNLQYGNERSYNKIKKNVIEPPFETTAWFVWL